MRWHGGRARWKKAGRRVGRYAAAVLAGQVGAAACAATGLTAWLLRAARWLVELLF